MNKRLIKLKLAYDGTAYLGWQKTAMGPSIERELETALMQLTQHPISLQAASRTDAGVHALGQLAVFETTHDRSSERWQLGINALLPPDIRVLDAQEIQYEHDPTRFNSGKEYHYWISTGPVQLPHLRHTAWHCPFSLDLSAMQAACPYLIGTHDFTAFCNVHKELSRKDPIRHLTSITIKKKEPNLLIIAIRGKSFLFRMARILVGTLVYIGKGKLSIGQLPHILHERKRALAGMTAPAHGLCLIKIFHGYCEEGEIGSECLP